MISAIYLYILSVEELEKKYLMFFETNYINDTGFIDPLINLDPDKHYFNEVGYSYTECKYYLEAGYNKKLHSLYIFDYYCSFIHLNIRRVMKNMSQFDNYFQNIHHKFTFISLSERWINEGTSDLFSINGYVCEHTFRSCKRGRGLSIFIRDQISYTLRNDLIVF